MINKDKLSNMSFETAVMHVLNCGSDGPIKPKHGFISDERWDAIVNNVNLINANRDDLMILMEDWSEKY